MKPIPMAYDLTHIPGQVSYFASVIAIHQPHRTDDGKILNLRQEFKNRITAPGGMCPQDIPTDFPDTLYEIVITKPQLIAMVDALVEQELLNRGIWPEDVK